MQRLLVVVALFSLVLGLAACTPPVIEDNTARKIAVKTTTAPAFTTQMVNGNLWAIPRGMDLERFPVIGRKLTTVDQVRYQLRLDRLTEDTVMFNEDRRGHSFPAKLIQAGTEVWKDLNGAVVYVAACGNRAMTPPDLSVCPPTVICYWPHVAAASTPSAATAVVTSTGFWSWLPEAILKIMWLLLGLLLLALLLAALALILWALARLVRALVEDYDRRRRPVAPPIPPVAPPPPPVAPIAPVPPPPPVVVVRRYGPYTNVVIADQGAAGHHVTADGVDFGTFTELVRTVDAGAAGHWLEIVT